MMARGDDAITTIPLRKATRDRLRAMGAKGETYDAILHRLMDAFQGRSSTEDRKPPLATPPRYVEFERVEGDIDSDADATSPDRTDEPDADR